jgi:hypothetical protein
MENPLEYLEYIRQKLKIVKDYKTYLLSSGYFVLRWLRDYGHKVYGKRRKLLS